MVAYIAIILTYILYEILIITVGQRKISSNALKKTQNIKDSILISLLLITICIVFITPIPEKSIKFGEYWRNAELLQNQRDVCLDFDYLRNLQRKTIEHPVYLFLHPDVPGNKSTPKKTLKRVKHFRKAKPTVFVLVSSANPSL